MQKLCQFLNLHTQFWVSYHFDKNKLFYLNDIWCTLCYSFPVTTIWSTLMSSTKPKLTNLAIACSGKRFNTGFKIIGNLLFVNTLNSTAGSSISRFFITLIFPPIHYWKCFNISSLIKTRSVLWDTDAYDVPNYIRYPIYSRSVL